jgi:hypothetical protein
MKKYTRARINAYRRLLREQAGGQVTLNTTLKELVSLGVVTQERAQSMVDSYNNRLTRGAAKVAQTSLIDGNIDTARKVIAYYLNKKYAAVPAGSSIHQSRKDVVGGKKVGFGKKDSEKMLQSVFDSLGVSYASGFGPGSPRGFVNVIFKEFVETGILSNNAADISNSAHMRYGFESGSELESKADGFDALGIDPDIIKEFRENELGLTDELDIGEELFADEKFFVADPYALEEMAEDLNMEFKNAVDDYINLSVDLGENVEFGEFDFDGDDD